MLTNHREVSRIKAACGPTETDKHMETAPPSEPTPMPIFILFDTQTGYLYGHLFATGPEDPFLQEVIQWWSQYCSNAPIGVDYPGLTEQQQPVTSLSSN